MLLVFWKFTFSEIFLKIVLLLEIQIKFVRSCGIMLCEYDYVLSQRILDAKIHQGIIDFKSIIS